MGGCDSQQPCPLIAVPPLEITTENGGAPDFARGGRDTS
jgi:hypothetical protein